MATVNDASALFKRVWGEGTIKAVPDFAKLQKTVPFSKREKLGDMYVEPVLLQHEHGFSYGAHGDGAFTLNSSVAGATKQAQVRGSMIVLRSQLSYEDVFKATESGPAAFEAAMGLVVENMQKSFAKRVELSLIYGQRGLATVSANSSGTLTITSATWAPGIWSGMKDCILEAFDGVTGSDTQHNTDLTVSAVSYSAKTVTVTGTSAAVVANDVLFFKGARTASAFKEMVGIDKIIVTASGSLFNVSVSDYELWRGQSRSVGGAMSMLAALNAASDASNLGLMDSAKLYLPVKRWNALNSDQSALRRYGAYSDKYENGSEGIVYHSTNGKIEVEAHPFIKEGEGFFLANPAKQVLRCGASDISFRRPGMQDEIFRELTDSAGLELRAFCDMGIMLRTPAQNVKLTGITD
jgi:hypothetical protein